MSQIKYSWSADGPVQCFNYYCSTSELNINSLPEPKAKGITSKSYIDHDVIAEQLYYVIFSSVRGSEEEFSNQITVSTATGDIYFDHVQLLIFADAETYPSKNIIDKSGENTTIVVQTPAQIINTNGGKYDLGALEIDLYKGQGGLDITLNKAIGLSDFTYEFHIKRSIFFSGWLMKIGGQFAVGGEGVGSLSIQTFENGTIKLVAISSESWMQTTFSTNIPESGFAHICVMRKDKAIYLFNEGVLVGVFNDPNLLLIGFNNKVFIGLKEASYYLNSIRFTTVARYDNTGFNPPILKYTTY